MEADTQNGESDDGFLECWLSSPTLEQYKQKLQDTLTCLAEANSPPDAKPHLKIYKYPQFLITVAVRHLLNNNMTDFLEEFKMFSPEDYKLSKDIADEIHDSLTSALMDEGYICTFVQIFDADLIAVKIKYEL